MIDAAELNEWAQRFGVSAAQISRDHFISHILHVLGRLHPQFTRASVRLRYADLPSNRDFRCPTPPTFAAMKLSAWSDRRAPRDLFDLTGLADLGVLRDPEVRRIYQAKWGHAIIDADFIRVPPRTADAWETELEAQVATLPPAGECLERVRAALTATRRSDRDAAPDIDHFVRSLPSRRAGPGAIRPSRAAP